MALQVTGKNIDMSDAFRTYVADKIEGILEKYIGREISGHVRLEKERSLFRTDCSLRLRTGLLLESHGTGADAYASADQAFEHLETRVRRYKRRLKDHHASEAAERANGTAVDAAGTARDVVLQLAAEEAEPTANADHPVIVAETEREIRDLTVGEAVMHLDLGSRSFLIFRNAGNGGINVVYRREDGNVGWIDPAGAEGS
jgi:ribosomal subunit interface protein